MKPVCKAVARNLFGGINFCCTILQSYILTSSAAISAKNNFQGLILEVCIPIYPRLYGPASALFSVICVSGLRSL